MQWLQNCFVQILQIFLSFIDWQFVTCSEMASNSIKNIVFINYA